MDPAPQGRHIITVGETHGQTHDHPQTHKNMTEQIWTIKKMLDWSRQYFADNRIEDPALEAQVLLGHALHMSKVELIINGMRPMDASELADYKAMVIRRVKEHVPTAYILGKKDFWSLSLDVSPDVLIPRPDTECLVEQVLAYVRAHLAGKPAPWIHAGNQDVTYETIDSRQQYYEAVAEIENSEKDTIHTENESVDICEAEHIDNGAVPIKIVDVGTGSGAIILAIASELSDIPRKLTAMDISSKALAIAKENASNLSVEDIEFIESDLLDRYKDTADIIVSNPPYISNDEMKMLSPEVLREPELALRAGDRGLDIYKRLIPQAFDKLKTGGALFVEIGCTQSQDVMALFEKSGFDHVQTFRDYAKKPRVVAGIKCGQIKS